MTFDQCVQKTTRLTNNSASPFFPTGFIPELSCHSYSSSSSSASPSMASFTNLNSALMQCSSTRRGAARSRSALSVSNTGCLDPSLTTTSLCQRETRSKMKLNKMTYTLAKNVLDEKLGNIDLCFTNPLVVTTVHCNVSMCNSVSLEISQINK